MKWNVSLSGTYTECREQLNAAVHTGALHNPEEAAKRAVAHYVVHEILDPAEKKHMSDDKGPLLERFNPIDAAKVAGPQSTHSISITVDVTGA